MSEAKLSANDLDGYTLRELTALLADENAPLAERVYLLNMLREAISEVSPFRDEPVDTVLWIPIDNVEANDYNPNAVAPPEMQLLEQSIVSDGYTQPIVSWCRADGIREVIDGFHRNRVGRESDLVRERIKGYLPLTTIRASQEDRGSRIASTIRHNRARGKHRVDAMSEIVIELKNRNWKNARISKELGMDEDEILRLCQITGLAELFQDEEFSKSWDVGDAVADFEPLTDEIEPEEKLSYGFRTVNTNDPDRIFHTWDQWECHKAGFYENSKAGMTREECEETYRALLADDAAFRKALDGVLAEWKNSCEHYLTNVSMNRIAWLGQAALCFAKGIPSVFRGGYNLLSPEQQDRANATALEYLNQWLEQHARDTVTEEDAQTSLQMNIY